MKEQLIQEVQRQMLPYLNNAQLKQLQGVLEGVLSGVELSHSAGMVESAKVDTVACFINAKRIEGCSEKTLSYYRQTIVSMLAGIEKEPQEIVTEDLRKYLTVYQMSRKSSKVTIDNIRRILSSYFSWLEDEDYIVKSPVRRIHKVKTAKVIKETYTDEALEIMRDNCCNVRDLAMIDLLASSGMRVGEMIALNRDDINFNERECVVFGKGSKERIVYFDARTKIHLQNYLESRTDTCSALFVSLAAPHDRLQIGGVERRLRELGKRLNLPRVHPHISVDIFSDEYLDKINAIQLPNTKIKVLQRLLSQAIDEYKKVNRIMGMEFSDRLKRVVDEYNNRRRDEAFANEVLDDVAEQLAKLLEELKKEKDSFKGMGIDYEEKAFYDILKAVAKKYEFEYPDDKMIELSKRIKVIVDDKAKYTDWSTRDDIKANLQVDLILLLDEFDYPPVTIDDVYKEVLEQAENFKKYSE